MVNNLFSADDCSVFTDTELSQLCGVPVYKVREYRTKVLGVYRRDCPKNYTHTVRNIPEIEFFKYSDDEIAERFNCSPYTVRNRRLKMGLKYCRAWTYDFSNVDFNKMTDDEIAELVGCSFSYVRKKRREAGIIRKRGRPRRDNSARS